MAGFAGSFEHSLDSKGRVIVPAALRERLGENFTIALNSENSAVALYPQDEWSNIEDRLKLVRSTDRMGNLYKRYIIANSYSNTNMDAQGRVLLPQQLRSKIGLTRDIIFIGMSEYVEIWDAALYREQEAAAITDFAALLEHMEEKYS